MKLFLLAAALLLSSSARASDAAKDPYKNDDDRALYTMGYLMGRNIAPMRLTPAEAKVLQAGVSDSTLDKAPVVDVRFHQARINDFLQKRLAAAAEKEKVKGRAFAEKFAKENKALAIPGGGWYLEVKAGDGAKPAAEDAVKAHYRGTLIDGKEFDSSYSRGEPTEFPLNRVIPCWTNGVGMMQKGGKAKLVCPSEVAYGDEGRGPVIPPGATLVFEIELVDIVKAAPADAKKDKKKK